MDSKTISRDTNTPFHHDGGFTAAQEAVPPYTPSPRMAESGQPGVAHATSDIPLQDQTVPADPNGTPNAMRPTMTYAPSATPQPQQQQQQQQIAYQVPFGPEPVPIQCPVCHQRTMSRVDYVSGGYTYGWALGLCAVTGCGCIPFCIKRLKNVKHRCGDCSAKLAMWHRYDGRVDLQAYGQV